MLSGERIAMPDYPDQVKRPPGQTDLTGKTVGRFVIEARLGAGGMGEVYRAVDSRLKRTVAIKRMSWRAGLTAADHALFLREGERASSLQHPNIASIYDVFEDNGEVLLVMEYVEGSTLRKAIGSPMPLEQFFDVAMQCASALTAAHEKGILHGDVKPENIMLGVNGQVKLLDFGVARRLPSDEDSDETVTTVWAPGHISGTPSYMAPEVLKGAQPDGRADIFALGIVYYEMLAGRHPFQGANVTVTTAHILDEREAATLDRTALKVAAPVAAIVARTLFKDPALRYWKARDLCNDLETVRQGGRPSRPLRRPLPKGQILLIPVLALVVAVAMLPATRSRVAGFWRPKAQAPVAVAKPQLPRLAVLPPQVSGADPQLTAFAEGLSATVAAKLSTLSQNHDLDVIDTPQVVKSEASSPATVLHDLGANLTLQLTVQRSGDLNRTTYKLARADDGQVMAEQTLTAPRSDPFSLQDRVADGVVKALQIDLRPEERTALALHGTTEPAAYDYYLQGQGYLQTTSRPENITNAIRVLQRAIALDENYGKAFALRGEAYWFNYEATKQQTWVGLASKDCRQAVTLGNAGAEGHLCLGLVAAGTGDYQQAANEYRNAVGLDPTGNEGYVGMANAYAKLNRLSDAEHSYQQAIALNENSHRAYQLLGAFYLGQAEYAKAILAFKQALRLAPENHMDYSNLGGAYLFLGDQANAITSLQKSLKLRPTAGAYANLGTAYYQSRRFTEAAASYHQAIEFNGQDPDLWGNLGSALLYSGQRAKAFDAFRTQLKLLIQQLQVNPEDAEREGDVASCYAILGEKDAALAHLARSLELGHGNKDLLFNAAVVYNDLGQTGVAIEWLQKTLAAGYSASIVRDSPSFDNLRKNRQFQQLLNQPLVN